MRGALAAVTGGTGFVGRAIVAALAARSWRVRVLARRSSLPDSLAGRCDVVTGELADDEALRRLVRGADAVIHAAGVVKCRHDAEFFRANARGSEQLGAAVAAAAPATRLVVISSLSARAPQLSAYAASKHAGERAIVSACGSAATAILRPAAVYGPGDRETLLVFRAARRVLVVPAHDGRITLVHVDDLADAVAALASDRSVSGTFEITDDRWRGYSWDEIANAAARALGTRPRVVRLPPALLRAAAPLLHLARFNRSCQMLTPGKLREILHGDWAASPGAGLPAQLWQPRISLDTGFSATARWYVDQGWLAPVARAG